MKIALMTTKQCNMRCKYCYFKDSKYEKKNMSLKIMRLTIEKMYAYCSRNNKRLTVQFFGGEPLIQIKNIKRLTTQINKKKWNITYTITTNGTLLNQNIANYLKDNSFNIIVSFDGSQKSHDSERILTNGRSSSKLSLDNLAYLQGYDKFSVTMTVTQKQVNNLVMGVLFLFKHGVKKVKVQTDMSKLWSKRNLEILKTQLKKLSKEYIKLKNKNPKYSLTTIDNYQEDETCLSNMHHKLFIDYDGTVSLCGCGRIGDNKMFELGKIGDSDILKKLNQIGFDDDNLERFKNKITKNKKIKSILQIQGLMFCDLITFKTKKSKFNVYIKNRMKINEAFKEAFIEFNKQKAINQVRNNT